MTKGPSILNRLPIAPTIAAMFALAAAILVMATPQWLFEAAVVSSGLPGLLPPAAPPLGLKAQIVATLVIAAIVGAATFALVTLVERLLAASASKARQPVAEPESDEARTLDQILAERRRPIFAEADLGAPLMSDEAAALARDELVLDTVVGDDGTVADMSAPAVDGGAAVMLAESAATNDDSQVGDGGAAAVEVPPVAMADPAPAMPWQAPVAEETDEESIADLLDRLEDALERRRARLGSVAPMPGDIQSLRAALGLRAAG